MAKMPQVSVKVVCSRCGGVCDSLRLKALMLDIGTLLDRATPHADTNYQPLGIIAASELLMVFEKHKGERPCSQL